MKTTDQIIHEARGLCWHEWEYKRQEPSVYALWCKKCRNWKDEDSFNLPSYTSSWADFGKALEWLKEQDFFGEFIEWLIKREELTIPPVDQAILIVFDLLTCLECDGEHGAGIIAEFLKERKP